jgi:hypothetical protein
VPTVSKQAPKTRGFGHPEVLERDEAIELEVKLPQESEATLESGGKPMNRDTLDLDGEVAVPAAMTSPEPDSPPAKEPASRSVPRPQRAFYFRW